MTSQERIERTDRIDGPAQDGPGGPGRPARRAVLTAAAGGGAAALLALAARALTGADDAGPGASPSAAAGDVRGRRTWANLIARRMRPEDVGWIVGRYRVVVLNDWDRQTAADLKQGDPALTVLMYQCLASTRSTDTPTHCSGGVLYSAADPEWFAVDAEGRRIEWSGYDDHWQMTTWSEAYRQAWVESVLDRLDTGPWDGVLADNDYDTLGHYSDAVLPGTGSAQATDALIRSGLDRLVRTAGPALQETGRLLVPNVSEGRYHLDRWRAHSGYGGAMEENFVHFSTTPGRDLAALEWESGGWAPQAEQVATAGLTLAVTRAARDDRASMRYGYATLLVMGDEDAYWMTRVDDDTYADVDLVQALPEADRPVGRPLGPARDRDGARVRSFEHAWAAVNPTDRRVPLAPPDGARTIDGDQPRRVDLDPLSGIVLFTG